MLNIDKNEVIVEREPLIEGEQLIVKSEYFGIDSTKVEPLLGCAVTSIQHFILYLIKKYPALENRLNANIINQIIAPIEKEYTESVVEVDEVYIGSKIKPEDEKELESKLTTEKSKKYFNAVIERHKGFDEYVKKFSTINLETELK